MSNNVSPDICGREHAVIVSLTIKKDAAKAIDFYKKVLGAKEFYQLKNNGKVVHAEILIGNTTIMISDEMSDTGSVTAENIGKMPISLYAYVDNVDETFDRAIKSGATIIYPVTNQFYGDRMGAFIDPFGFQWSVAKHVEDVPMDKIEQQAKKMIDQMQQSGGNAGNEISKHNLPLRGQGNDGDIYHRKYLKYKNKYNKLKK